jgi:hypothetical protein
MQQREIFFFSKEEKREEKVYIPSCKTMTAKE